MESTAWGALNIIGQQFKPKALSKNWLNRLGIYRCQSDSTIFDSDIEIKSIDGVIIMCFKLSDAWGGQLIETALQPTDNNKAIIRGLGRNTGELIKFNFDCFEMGGLKFNYISPLLK